MVRSRGFALLAVLWVVALLAFLAGETRREGVLARVHAAGREDAVQANYLLRSGVDLGVFALRKAMLGDPDSVWALRGESRTFETGAGSVTVGIVSEGGKIDLNTADRVLLGALFTAVGEEPDAAAALADKVIDWRDADSLSSLNGAESVDYRRASLPWQPRNRPFQRIGELARVMDVTPDLFLRVKDHVTVSSSLRAPSLYLAASAVRDALVLLGRQLPDVGAAPVSVLAPHFQTVTVRVSTNQEYGRLNTGVYLLTLSADLERPFVVREFALKY